MNAVLKCFKEVLRYNANEVVDHVKESIEGFKGFPNGIEFEFTGEVASIWVTCSLQF